MGKTFKKIYSICTTLLVVGMVLLAVLLGGVRLIGFTPYAVLSGSMEPTYPVGSLIYVKEVPYQEIKPGDAITFVLNEDLVVATHRVVEVSEDGENFYTKGDANESVDAAPVYYKNIVGKATFQIPYLGYVSSFLTTKKGMTVGACGFVCIMILLFFPDLMNLLEGKGIKKKKSQETSTANKEVEM